MTSSMQHFRHFLPNVQDFALAVLSLNLRQIVLIRKKQRKHNAMVDLDCDLKFDLKSTV